MAGLMDSVNQRTQLVGQNRLELLLFRLEGPHLYGINVFKVKEVLQSYLLYFPLFFPLIAKKMNEKMLAELFALQLNLVQEN